MINFPSSSYRYLKISVNNRRKEPVNILQAGIYQTQPITPLYTDSLNQSIIGYLNKGQSYSLLFGDSIAVAPNYDLKFFADSIEREMMILEINNIGHNPSYRQERTKEDSSIPAWLIWVAIAIVLGILAYLTIRMTKEIEKKKTGSE